MACPRPLQHRPTMDCRGPCGPRNDEVEVAAGAGISAPLLPLRSLRESLALPFALPSSRLCVNPRKRGPGSSPGRRKRGTDAAPSPPRVICWRPQAPGAARPRCLAFLAKARARVRACGGFAAVTVPCAPLVAPRPPLGPIPAPALSRG